MATPTTALAAAVSPLLGVEAPHAEDEADEDGASNQGQEEDWQRLLWQQDSPQGCDAHAPESSAARQVHEPVGDRVG
jgi:hypothetical protein